MREGERGVRRKCEGRIERFLFEAEPPTTMLSPHKKIITGKWGGDSPACGRMDGNIMSF